ATARSREVGSETQLLEAADDLGLPLILKPTNLFNSLWVSFNPTRRGLLENYRAMRAEVPRYYAGIGQQGKELAVQAEEFLQGSNHSVDCLIDASGHVRTTPVVDVLTGRDIGADDFHHFARITPSALAVPEQEEAAD